MLCGRCQVLCSSINPTQDNLFPHHDTAKELGASAASGCALCKIIHGEMEEKPNQSITSSYRVTVKTIRDTGIEVSFVDPVSSQNGKKPLVLYVVFQNVEVPRQIASALQLLQNSPDVNTGSETAFQLASSWLEECLEHHATCSATVVGDPPLPHRVIDVGLNDNLAEPYLLETSSNQVGKYLTLSHCWGGGTPIKTTTENIQHHRSEIRLVDLPPTFRDAVLVAQKIGTRYLWIDSLCIIQDDRKDWEVEATMMHQYYQNSLLTVAAADGNGSEAGLFRDRNRLRNQPCELQITHVDGFSRQVYAYTNNMSFELSRSSISASYQPIPLYSRAWVFQEQALSPRTLSYARDRISWRCQEMIFDERVPFKQGIEEFIKKDKTASVVRRKGDPRTTDATIAELQRKWIFPIQSQDRSGREGKVGYHEKDYYLPDDDFLIDWGHIIQDYTERDMTYHSDKLIAIQGIADAVAPIVSRTYFAGTWIDSPRSIFMGLLWTSQRRGRKPVQRIGIAPSWSWASTDGEVTWYGHILYRLESKIEILNLSHEGSAVRAVAELVVEANVRLGRTEENHGFSIVDWPNESMETLAEENINPYMTEKWPLDMSATPTSLDESLEGNVPIWFMELAAGDIHAQAKRKYVHCLVLIRSGEDNSKFRRVGYSMWKEEKWGSSALPETRKMKLSIV